MSTQEVEKRRMYTIVSLDECANSCLQKNNRGKDSQATKLILNSQSAKSESTYNVKIIRHKHSNLMTVRVPVLL